MGCTAISAGDAMMRETRSLNPPPVSVVVVHVIPWIQRGKGGGSGCWVLFYHHSNPSIERGRMDRNECKSGITTVYSYLKAEILCDIAPGDAKYM